jgi:hydroxyethylthiazole kinase-like uncharacterized protein yjeF
LSRQSEVRVADSGEAKSITEEWASSILPRREAGAHKWGVGGVVVVAGSPGFAGAAALCCAGAGRSGAGIVSVALPRSIAPIVVGLIPEATVIILPEGDSFATAKRAVDVIAERLHQARSLVVGPGLGDDEATDRLLGALFGSSRAREAIGFGTNRGGLDGSVDNLVSKSGVPVVVDADGLNWLARQDHWWDNSPPGRFVLTPHPGEMARLANTDIASILSDPVATARDAAAAWNHVVVLKGAKTVVAAPDGSTRFVETSPALATAGSGDVLSGSIGALLAQGLSPADAAALAVYVGDRAALRLATRLGTLGVVAGDLPLAIAEELGALESRGA